MDYEQSTSKKHKDWLLKHLERKWIDAVTPKIPIWLGSVPLTLLSVIWCIAYVFCAYQAVENLAWLHCCNACIVLHYITDSLDGAVGRLREEGLIKWGYFMDHFLDFCFMCCVMAGYFLVVGEPYQIWVVLWLCLMLGFMMRCFLVFPVTQRFEMSSFLIGPTEAQLGVILLNICIIYQTPMLLETLLPGINIVVGIALLLTVHTTQKKLWHMDQRNIGKRN